MTQEELDALMSDSENMNETLAQDASDTEFKKDDGFEDIEVQNYKTNPNIIWPPPPPNKEHKVVHQLDDVTKDSEKKATEMMDKLETINNFFADSENLLTELNKVFDRNLEIFSKLHNKFPNVQTFMQALEDNQNIKNKSASLTENLQNGQDEVMMAMDTMQYQDIHRQKIERVINVMRALSRYMSSLFEGKIEDKKRVSSATHIEGDSTADVVSNDEIEALIASLGQK